MGERAYAYAKACGITGKSFVGRRTAALHSVSRLSELDRLIFGPGARELPERELLPDLEKRLLKRSVDAILSIVNSYRDPPELLAVLVRVYEYNDLKEALSMIPPPENALARRPVFVDLGRFGRVRFNQWPNARAMLKQTEFEFLLEEDGRVRREYEGLPLDTVLDRHYYKKLWQSIRRLKKSDRQSAEDICTEEISLRNCAWVLRLRTYYGMIGEEVKRHLVVLEEQPHLSRDALEALDLPLDSRGEWERWRRVRFLNPEVPHSRRTFPGAGIWNADPRYFQNAAAKHLYKLALRSFRKKPSSVDAAFCFIKLKQFEEDLVTSNAEGLDMGMAGRDVSGILETEV
ncbi:MAG: V-type ATPase subunit [Spirochaetaceae bacterium]|jgi:vacuolar-type H+-ATPase subunit C/Vma6|nr:V-type ATPase subunit [Spirochaetaceae bacterium]